MTRTSDPKWAALRRAVRQEQRIWWQRVDSRRGSGDTEALRAAVEWGRMLDLIRNVPRRKRVPASQTRRKERG